MMTQTEGASEGDCAANSVSAIDDHVSESCGIFTLEIEVYNKHILIINATLIDVCC